MDRQTVKILTEEHDIKDINDFVDMDEDERKKVLKGKDIDKIAAACNRYPTMNLTYEFGQRTEEEVELIVHL